MIPKVIHYGWFGNGKMPETDKKCIESWKKYCPDFEIKFWDETNFKDENEYLKKARDTKKWGFFIDYFKFKVIYEFGGVYMDTDMLLLKPIDHLLENKSFWSFESDVHVNTAIIGSEKNNPIIKQCLEFYTNFKYSDVFLESPKIITPELKKIGLIDDNGSPQYCEENLVLPYIYFYPMSFQEADGQYQKFIKEESLGVHMWNASWFDPFRFFWNGRIRSGWKAVLATILKNPFQGLTFYRNVFYHLRKSIFGYETIQKGSE